MDRMHSGSQAMLDLLDNAIEKTNVIPDAVFTAHVHNYQRFTRTYSSNINNPDGENKKKVPFIVAGSGDIGICTGCKRMLNQCHYL